MKISSIDNKNIILDKLLSLHLELHITLFIKRSIVQISSSSFSNIFRFFGTPIQMKYWTFQFRLNLV
jgi:hypothetical protein